jgi:hypothetical protein
MLQVLTTDEFASWFRSLDDKTAEDVATALDVVEELGPDRSPSESRDSLLWYEHPMVSRFDGFDSVSWWLEAWARFKDYAKQVIEKLESPRFMARVARLGPTEAKDIFNAIQEIKNATNPRAAWSLKLLQEHQKLPRGARPPDPCLELRRLYFVALEAAGFQIADIPDRAPALREFCRRIAEPAFRLVYGVSADRTVALFLLGEWLDRSFYGDSVRRAEAMWKQYQEGALRAEAPQLR